MRLPTLAALGAGLALSFASAASSQPIKWDMACHYTNGSIAFMVSLAQHRTSGDMPSDQLAISDAQIVFDVAAERTTLLQAFHVIIDRNSLKWTTQKPGTGGVCQKF